MKAPVIGIYGPSGGGKTTWICAVTAALRARGVRAATVKTCHHDPEIEPTRKDSARHLESGAEAVLLLSPGKRMVVERREREVADAHEGAIDEIDAFAASVDADVVLVEGARDGLHPKIAVLATKIPWNLARPFPLLARVGRPPATDNAHDWTETAGAAAEIIEWLSFRASVKGVLGVILAGGHGRRLGGVNKARIEREGVSLAARAAANLRVFLEKVVLSGPDPLRLEGHGLPILPDAPGAAGPLGGVIAGLEMSERGILILGVDQVGVTPRILEQVLKAGLEHGAAPPGAAVHGGGGTASNPGAAVAAAGEKFVPTIAYLDRRHLSLAREAASGSRSLTALFEKAEAVRVSISPEEAADVDTQDDLARHGLNAGAA